MARQDPPGSCAWARDQLDLDLPRYAEGTFDETLLGEHRSVINRQLTGLENLTLRRVAELAWALGWDIVFELRRPKELAEQATPLQTPWIATQATQAKPAAIDCQKFSAAA